MASCKVFNTSEEAEDDYSKYVLKEKRNHEVGKGAYQIRWNELKNLIIFVPRSSKLWCCIYHLIICDINWSHLGFSEYLSLVMMLVWTTYDALVSL